MLLTFVVDEKWQHLVEALEKRHVVLAAVLAQEKEDLANLPTSFGVQNNAGNILIMTGPRERKQMPPEEIIDNSRSQNG